MTAKLIENSEMRDNHGPDGSVAGAILTIDLGAVRENYRRLKRRLGGARCAAVVKANGYGLGAAEVVKALVKEGCDTFFVAHRSEGVALRAAVGSSPVIYVLNGLAPGAEEEAMAADLRPVLNSRPHLDAWQALASRSKRRLQAAVQVDSGMSRLGMQPAEVEILAANPSLFDDVEITLVMSHLACADEPNNPANAGQLARFERLQKKLPRAPVSFANSSGIFLGSAYHFDLGRPGVALYGVNPTPGHENPMLPVVKLEARVIQTREVGAGAGIGYGYSLVAQEPMRLATISLGYADGWHRRGVGFAWLGDIRLPFAGRVSMDSIILDISALEPGQLKAGDLVEMIGPNQSVDVVAGYASTIGYEILTSLGSRFHRRYVDGQH